MGHRRQFLEVPGITYYYYRGFLTRKFLDGKREFPLSLSLSFSSALRRPRRRYWLQAYYTSTLGGREGEEGDLKGHQVEKGEGGGRNFSFSN